MKCGSPRPPGVILCRFCRTPFDEEEARRATPCPKCKDLFAPTTQRCDKCNVWLVVQCVFCDALSPYTHADCDRCGEVFAGAPARKAAREAAGPTWGSAAGAAPAPAAGGFGWPDAASGGGGSGFDAWGPPPSPPEPDAADLFSSFGQPKPADDDKAQGWDPDSWGAPKRRR